MSLRKETPIIKSSMSSISTLPAEGQDIRRYFDAIAVRYDFLNHLLSWRLDESWRRRARDIVLEGWEESVLDLGIGTGKFIALFDKAKDWKRIAGIDFSLPMLQRASSRLSSKIKLTAADFQKLPFKSGSFDLIISAFTLRSVREMNSFLSAVYDVLKKPGKAAFLCLTRPRNAFWKILYLPYLKFYLPVVGGLISGNRKAYQFLSSSVLQFQEPDQTAEMMRETGFRDIEIRRFSFGMATLITAKKI